MELARLFDELVGLAEGAGIGVRVEVLRPAPSDARSKRGGLCTVRGKRFILVDDRGRLPDRIATLVEGLVASGVDFGALDPVVRATLGALGKPAKRRATAAASADKRPLAKGRPGRGRKNSPSDPGV